MGPLILQNEIHGERLANELDMKMITGNDNWK